MGQRYHGRPLAGDGGPDLGLAVSALLATGLSLLVATAIEPATLDAMTTGALLAVLGVPALTALLFGGHDGWRLRREIRAAEAAGSVSAPAGGPPSSRAAPGLVLVLGAVMTGVNLGGGAALCVGLGALIAGRQVGAALSSAFVRRSERRLGRRFYRTIGEPEKVVWLGAPGLD
jgi:hypothetical protein